MEFKLNLEPHGQHQMVDTGAMIDRARAMARVRAASAGAGSAFDRAMVKASALSGRSLNLTGNHALYDKVRRRSGPTTQWFSNEVVQV